MILQDLLMQPTPSKKTRKKKTTLSDCLQEVRDQEQGITAEQREVLNRQGRTMRTVQDAHHLLMQGHDVLLVTANNGEQNIIHAELYRLLFPNHQTIVHDRTWARGPYGPGKYYVVTLDLLGELKHFCTHTPPSVHPTFKTNWGTMARVLMTDTAYDNGGKILW